MSGQFIQSDWCRRFYLQQPGTKHHLLIQCTTGKGYFRVHKSTHARGNNVKIRFSSAEYAPVGVDRVLLICNPAGLSTCWRPFPHLLIFPLKPAAQADIYKGACNSYKKWDVSGTTQLTWMRNARRRNGVEKFSWQTNLQNLFENGKNNVFFFSLADFTAYHIQGQLGVLSNFISLL